LNPNKGISISAPLRVLIIARDQSSHVQQAWESLKTFLNDRPMIEVVDALTTDEECADWSDVDVAIVLGGDGAILRACRMFDANQVPMLGINLGRLGFLADLSPEQFRQQVDLLEKREFDVVPHLMFECEHRRADGTITRHLGLNETAILSGASLALIDIDLSINDQDVTTYSGDGLIVSTPVGSTAHNLSAGGPILKQDLKAFVVTPICPHTLTIRPMIDSADVTYHISVPEAPEGVMLVIDGQIKEPLHPDDEVIIKQADVDFQLVRLSGHNFYATLHQKLGWQGQPRYRRKRRK